MIPAIGNPERMFVGKFYKFKEGTYADLGTPNKLL
jgi:hypothetical protein